MADAQIAQMSFETAMAELEQVVTQLERGDVALDDSITLYERGAFQLEIQTSQKTHNKDIKIVKRYKSNELNPFAEKEMIKMIEKNIYKEILDEIIREVSSFEM